MPCHCQDSDNHQNSSFIFGLIIGLIIAAVVAIVIYKNNREDVIIKLKKQLENFFSTIGRSASGGKPNSEEIIKNKKKDVIIPQNLVIADKTPKLTFPKAKKMFKK